MRTLLRPFGYFLVCLLISAAPVAADEDRFGWEELPNLPPAGGEEVQKGLAGAFAGSHNGALILAGGANFPDGVPWKDGVKAFWNDIYVLEKDSSGKPKWVEGIMAKLPKPLAYGASVSTDYGVICIGGVDSSQCYSDVFLLRWDSEKKQIEVEELPPLPVPLAYATASRVGDLVFVAGGISEPEGGGTKSFFVMDLEPGEEKAEAEGEGEPEDGKEDASSEGTEGEEGSKEGAETEPAEEGTAKEGKEDKENTEDKPKAIRPEIIELPDGSTPEEPEPGETKPTEPLEPLEPLEWKALTAWGGSPRAFAASAAQFDGKTGCFFLFSGRNPKADGTSEQLFDSHKYDPESATWTQFPDIAPLGEKARSVVAASATASGDRSILIIGGDDGTMAKIYALVAAAANSTSREAYLKLNESILENHPGYSRDILALDTVDAVWKNVATFPESCPVTTQAVLWDSSVVIPSGEIRPGVRSIKVWKGNWKSK